LRRLPSDWPLPHLVAAPLKYAAIAGRASASGIMPSAGPELYGRAEEADRHLGTVVHYWLERITLDGLNNWSRERLDQIQLPVQRQLIALGVGATRIPNYTEEICRALQAVLDSRRGRWLLSAHAEAASEYPLAGILDGEVIHAVVDRTFVDKEGTRWVIDYKTSLPFEKEIPVVFYQRESERYRDQLTRYAALFRSLEPSRSVRTALYFPMFGGWCEIPLADQGKDDNINTEQVI
jgi:ATP-dependent exoDNAse (exonuclease V) beta subunit